MPIKLAMHIKFWQQHCKVCIHTDLKTLHPGGIPNPGSSVLVADAMTTVQHRQGIFDQIVYTFWSNNFFGQSRVFRLEGYQVYADWGFFQRSIKKTEMEKVYVTKTTAFLTFG
jgi:predicted membrane-bound spermidine synthase